MTVVLLTGKSAQGKTTTFEPMLEKLGFTILKPIFKRIASNFFADDRTIYEKNNSKAFHSFRDGSFLEDVYSNAKKDDHFQQALITGFQAIEYLEPGIWEKSAFIDTDHIKHVSYDPINEERYGYCLDLAKQYHPGEIVVTLDLQMDTDIERSGDNRTPIAFNSFAEIITATKSGFETSSGTLDGWREQENLFGGSVIPAIAVRGNIKYLHKAVSHIEQRIWQIMITERLYGYK